jgi:hypothetical protein
MKYKLGERVWLWRKLGPERWTLVSGVVRRRHRDETVTVDFQTRNGKWTMRRNQGYPATDGARISTQAVYREEKVGRKALPVEYERLDV